MVPNSFYNSIIWSSLISDAIKIVIPSVELELLLLMVQLVTPSWNTLSLNVSVHLDLWPILIPLFYLPVLKKNYWLPFKVLMLTEVLTPFIPSSFSIHAVTNVPLLYDFHLWKLTDLSLERPLKFSYSCMFLL